MNYILIENLAVLLCAGIGFASGIRYLNTKKGMYAAMVVQGMICIVLGRLYQCAHLWTGGSLSERFQVGALGVMGAFSFFFSANFGPMDSLVDDGGKSFIKYRIYAWIGSACVLSMLIPILLSPASRALKIVSIVTLCITSASCYFHVKHLLIRDVDYGVASCLRGYNALAIVVSVMSMLELIALAWESELLFLLSGAGLCVASLSLVPVMGKGVERWQT